jgi:uncharacterized protein YdeI (YjbR/CyaY-like superfamily)
MATETYLGVKTFHARKRAEWRKWLENNHGKTDSVWLIIYRKQSGIPSVYCSEAVDEALCFGWIDSKPNKSDDKSFYQYFSRRNPKSNWSKVNKDKVEKLLSLGLMAPAGLAMIEIAKRSGIWNALDKVSSLEIPAEMMELLLANKQALANWEAFPPSIKRALLEGIQNAKKPETRSKRIQQVVDRAAANDKVLYRRS